MKKGFFSVLLVLLLSLILTSTVYGQDDGWGDGGGDSGWGDSGGSDWGGDSGWGDSGGWDNGGDSGWGDNGGWGDGGDSGWGDSGDSGWDNDDNSDWGYGEWDDSGWVDDDYYFDDNWSYDNNWDSWEYGEGYYYDHYSHDYWYNPYYWNYSVWHYQWYPYWTWNQIMAYTLFDYIIAYSIATSHHYWYPTNWPYQWYYNDARFYTWCDWNSCGTWTYDPRVYCAYNQCSARVRPERPIVVVSNPSNGGCSVASSDSNGSALFILISLISCLAVIRFKK